MQSVWAANASVGKDASEFDAIPFHQTAATKIFLDAGDDKLFICGLKGVGKTLLLKKKSQEVRRRGGITLAPRTELVEKLNPIVYSMSAADEADLSIPTIWARVWQMALAAAMVRRLIEEEHLDERNLPEAVRANFPENSSSVSYHIARLLSMGPAGRRVLVESSSASLVSLLERVSHGVYLFVDAIDDAVSSHAGVDLKETETGTLTQLGRLSRKVWQAAQIGFVQAAARLHETYRHIKVFGALRKEAIDAEPLPDRQNLETYLLPLEYTRADLKGIFLTKLRALRERDRDSFLDPDNEDIVAGFLGFNSLRHPFVRTEQQEALEEHVLDYIIRHTRGRPRELDVIGESLQLIHRRSGQSVDVQEKVRAKVRDKSRVWFEWAKSEAIPYWSPALESVLGKLDSNFIDAAYARKRIASQETLRELFALGLVGCPVAEENGPPLQRFRQNDPELPVSDAEFRVAKHYIVHPSVNLATRAIKERYVPDGRNVAGHGYPFVRQEPARHVHFGAGRLGIGLVLPLLASYRGGVVCIVQRPDREGKRLEAAQRWATNGSVEFSYAFRPSIDAVPQVAAIASAAIVLDEHGPRRQRRAIDDWRAGRKHLFCLTANDALVGEILGYASSASTAVRDASSLVAFAAAITTHGREVLAVYPFENDEAVPQLLRSHLPPSVRVVDVVADRICRDVIVTKDGLRAHTELSFHVVLNDDSPLTRGWFGSGQWEGSQRVEFESELMRFRFAKETKRCLVNGLHFAYVLYGYRLIRRRFPDRDDVVGYFTDSPVAEVLCMTQEVQDELDRVANLYRAHLLVRADELGLISGDESCEAWDKRLRARYDSVLDRLMTTRDQLVRMLRPDVKAVVDRMRRLVEPLQTMSERAPRAKQAWRYLQECGWTSEGLTSAAKNYKGDCTELFGYLEERVTIAPPAEEVRTQAPKTSARSGHRRRSRKNTAERA